MTANRVHPEELLELPGDLLTGGHHPFPRGLTGSEPGELTAQHEDVEALGVHTRVRHSSGESCQRLQVVESGRIQVLPGLGDAVLLHDEAVPAHQRVIGGYCSRSSART